VKRIARLVAVLALVLTGCAQVDQWKALRDGRIVDIRSKRLFDLTRTGVAFMSLGASSGKCIRGGYSVLFRPVPADTPEMRFHAVTSKLFGASNAVIQSPQSCVEVVGMSLPPGDYRISDVLWSAELGTMQGSVDSNRFMSTRFTVRAGQITYLGSFQVVFRYGEDFLGRRVVVGGEYGVTDELDRDLKKLCEVRPDLRGIPVKAQLPPGHVGAGAPALWRPAP
jgi:hypothetical protein